MLRPATNPKDPEAAARAALEARAGRHLTDDEWETAKQDFLAMFRLLKTWNTTIPPNTERPATRVLSLAIQQGSG